MGNFNKVLRALRTSKNMTQDELAKILRISRSTVGMYEKGDREPDYETLEAIADYFNVSIDYLLGRDTKIVRLIAPNTLAAHFDGDEYTEDELAEIHQFAEFVKTKRPSSPELAAAHARTDITSTPEGQAHDNAIMDDDSEWE